MIGATVQDLDDLKFNIVENKQKGIAAIVEMAAPYVVLSIFDFKDQRFWPFTTPTQNSQESYDQGKKLISLLNISRPENQYVLASDVPGNTRLKVAP
jgi:hypothetical protein